ncbi:MAG: M20/M25/M40 family metallo-hydrolase [Eubacteriales bacterium]|nr:M20/M25/M40 family metallo-hydrolase [Eubacteriales bacterium]
MGIGIALLAAVVALAAVVLLRAMAFRPKEQIRPEGSEISFDAEAAVKALQSLVRCRTVSHADPSQEDEKEFEKLLGLLPELYPAVFAACEYMCLPDRALLLRWKGKACDAPGVMMAHYDVVPVDESGWEKPPFAGIIEDGVLWGRGSLDTKVTLNGVLSAADALIREGFIPEQDVYFAFSGGEEVAGKGAVRIVEWFKGIGIVPALVLDEGGAVVEGVFPGLKAPCGLIGIAEKGSINAVFSVRSEGGHASAPKPRTPLGILARACCRLEKKPFPLHITKPAAEMFDTLGRHCSFAYRLLFANLWLFRAPLDLLCRKTGGELNALLRTTVALTQAEGSEAANVIPTKASMTANLRLNPRDSVSSALERLRRIIADPAVEVRAASGTEPSPISETNCPAWDKVVAAVADTWPGCIVSPYLMVQCSDSRHYRDLSNHVYRFSAMAMTGEERASVHGNNERIRVEAIGRAVEFYIRLLRRC